MNFKQWIKQAYGVDANEDYIKFSVYNMGVAYEAGKQQNDWISVKDALPEKYKECLVYPWIDDYTLTAQLSLDGWVYSEYIHNWGAETRKLPAGRITHWKYLKGPGEHND